MNVEISIRAAFVDFVVSWGLGWRYIASRQFRRRVHERWATRSKRAVAVDAVFLVLAFLIVNGFIVLACIWLYVDIVGELFHGPDRDAAADLLFVAELRALGDLHSRTSHNVRKHSLRGR